MAWHVGVLSQTPGKSLPALHTIMGEKPPPFVPPSGDEIAARMQMFADAHNTFLAQQDAEPTPHPAHSEQP